MYDREQLRGEIAQDSALRELLSRMEQRSDGDPGHDLAHALRVAVWTVRLASDEVRHRESIAAALLHDAVNIAKDSPERHLASKRSAELAKGWLEELGFQPTAVERVFCAIRDHSYSRGATPTSDLGRALQDADRLEALGALGLFRTVSTGTRMGARYFDPNDPWADNRELDDMSFMTDHFFTKLLGLPKTMATEGGRAEASLRCAFLRTFLGQLAKELGTPINHSEADGPNTKTSENYHRSTFPA